MLGLSKLLICGGNNPISDTCEVMDIVSAAKTCKNLPNFPSTIHSAVGGLGFQETPTICGGEQDDQLSNMCYSFKNSEWVSSESMNSVRVSAAAAQFQNSKILVTGGDNVSDTINSVEMLTEEGWENIIPLLPVTIVNHCIVIVNSTTVMVIGGFQNNQFSGNSFYFTFGEDSWKEGPELKNKRTYHSCGRIRSNEMSQEMSIIVVGGSDGSYLSSVEILDEDSNEWQTGPELPFGISSSQMVEDQNGGVVLIGGGSSGDYLDTLYQLPHGGREAEWTKMQQKLKIGRQQHTAFLVPDNIFDCS